MIRTALYRHFDDEGRLLYVGVTDCVIRRNADHHAKSHWFNLVRKTEVEFCRSREHALALEKVAIQFEAPLHNVTMTPELAGAKIAPFAADMKVIFEVWPTVKDLADDLCVAYTTAHSWKLRGQIPAIHDMNLITAASKRGVALTLEALAAARKKPSLYRLTELPVGAKC